MATAPARHHGKAFDEVAAEYDRNRPTYPDELVDRACELAGVGSGDPVLEIGCGSGQLTRSLLARGLRVTALEPGARLLSLARRNVANAAEVEFVNARFEDAQLTQQSFGAVFSASAFHWIDPAVSWEKTARLLAPGGALALIQYCGLDEQRSSADQAALLSTLARIAPEFAAEWPDYRDLPALIAGAERRRSNVSRSWAWIASQDVARPEASDLFRDAQIATVPSVLEQTADELNGLLRTLSFYPRMSPAQRQALEREHVVLYERLGRPIRSGIVAVAVVAQRRDGSAAFEARAHSGLFKRAPRSYHEPVSGPRLPGGVVHKLPADLRGALIANATALDAWKNITPLARNEFICWVEDAKQATTRERRIRRTGEELEEGMRRPCCWPGCKHRERNGK
jgi:ubiquinone/menaquinone biosynthesis C-methylase UbiE